MDPSARSVFVFEARELLAEMERTLLQLEQDDSSELINAAFRAAHTIKGAAGLFDLELITSFTQVLESVLERARSGQLHVDDSLVSILLSCCDYLGKLVSAIEARSESVDPDPEVRARLLDTLRALSHTPGRTSALAHVARAPALEAFGHWHLSLRFSAEVLQKGLDPLAFIAHLRELGTIIYAQTHTDGLPRFDDMDPQRCYLGFEVGLRSSASRQRIESAFDFVRDDCQIQILPPEARVAEYIQIIRSQSGSRRKLGELLVESGAMRQQDLEQALALQEQQAPGQRSRLGEVVVSQQLVAAPVVAAALTQQKQRDERRVQEQHIVKVEARKLDQLINLVGELVIASEGARITAARAANAELQESLGRVGQFVEQLRDRALAMRMIAIGEVFTRFPRVVRDVSKELGKDIQLVITGAECELDKSMVDQLFDPLLHIVRNALDHGIEAVAERTAQGKRPQGKLRLHAYHDSGSIVIEISDDGRGLSRDKILAKAVQRELVPAGADLSDAQVYQLIFLPGFSTAEQVTGLSGRGVGMDVVKRAVEQLRGEIDIATRLGRGTRFRIRLPLTLAIVDGFQIALGDSTFVLPLESVVECIGMTQVEAAGTQTIMSLRGEPLPYVRLREVFGMPPLAGARESLVVVAHGARRVGVVVDRLIGDMQAVIKPLGQLFRGNRAVSSSTILGDGTVALILDVPTLVARAEQASSSPRARAV